MIGNVVRTSPYVRRVLCPGDRVVSRTRHQPGPPGRADRRAKAVDTSLRLARILVPELLQGRDEPVQADCADTGTYPQLALPARPPGIPHTPTAPPVVPELRACWRATPPLPRRGERTHRHGAGRRDHHRVPTQRHGDVRRVGRQPGAPQLVAQVSFSSPDRVTTARAGRQGHRCRRASPGFLCCGGCRGSGRRHPDVIGRTVVDGGGVAVQAQTARSERVERHREHDCSPVAGRRPGAGIAHGNTVEVTISGVSPVVRSASGSRRHEPPPSPTRDSIAA